jgi:hypothetical protein
MGHIYATYKLNEGQLAIKKKWESEGREDRFHQEEYELKADEETRKISIKVGDVWLVSGELTSEQKEKHSQEVCWVSISAISFVQEFKHLFSGKITPERRAELDKKWGLVPDEWYEEHKDEALVIAPMPKKKK